MGEPRILLMVGEASGDLHGSNLAKKIRELAPNAELFGMGGKLMKEAGVELLFDPTQMSIIGFAEAVKAYRSLRRVLSYMEKALDERRPDVVVLIDFPGFNMKFGEMAKRREIPVIYYFCPTAWAWGKGRAKKVAAFTSRVASVFPFEYETYREAGANVEFVGHPLLDIVQTTKSREELCQEVGLDPKKPIIGLLPGSRRQELLSLFPIMLDAARILASRIPDVQFLVPLAHTVSREIVDSMDLQGLLIKMVSGETYNVMAACDAAVVACGTATLEAALLNTPLVAIYRVAPATYFLGKRLRLVKIDRFALPNIVAGRDVVPELIQHEVTPEKIAELLWELWHSTERRKQMLTDYQEIRTKLGQPGAVGRVAQLVLETAEQSRSTR